MEAWESSSDIVGDSASQRSLPNSKVHGGHGMPHGLSPFMHGSAVNHP